SPARCAARAGPRPRRRTGWRRASDTRLQELSRFLPDGLAGPLGAEGAAGEDDGADDGDDQQHRGGLEGEQVAGEDGLAEKVDVGVGGAAGGPDRRRLTREPLPPTEGDGKQKRSQAGDADADGGRP